MIRFLQRLLDRQDAAYRRQLQAQHDAWLADCRRQQAIIDAERADDRARQVYYEGRVRAAWVAAGCPNVSLDVFAIAPPTREQWKAMEPGQKANPGSVAPGDLPGV